MKEIKDIIAAFDKAQAAGKQTALATVVHVDGSSYRRPGARMLVTEDGDLTGAISGGCLEGDALRKALLVMAKQKPTLVTYDTSDEDDAQLGMGLGCNGIIQVLIEPIDNGNPENPLALLKSIASERKECCLVTLFSLTDRKHPSSGTVLLLKTGGITGCAAARSNRIVEDAKQLFSEKRSAFKTYVEDEDSLSAFFEFLPPQLSLVVAGAGNDVMPLVDIATILGWKITVVDGRPAYAKKERFMAGCNVLLLKPADVLKHITVDEQTVFVLMTHNFNYDKALLEVLLKEKVRYIGMLGPAKKRDRMLNELSGEGILFTEAQLARLFSPVGLEIGAQTPEEIALSIVAEIQAVLADRIATPLKLKNGTIHSRSETKIETVKINESRY